MLHVGNSLIFLPQPFVLLVSLNRVFTTLDLLLFIQIFGLTLDLGLGSALLLSIHLLLDFRLVQEAKVRECHLTPA